MGNQYVKPERQGNSPYTRSGLPPPKLSSTSDKPVHRWGLFEIHEMLAYFMILSIFQRRKPNVTGVTYGRRTSSCTRIDTGGT